VNGATPWFAIGLDLGGTDLKAGLVTPAGQVEHFLRRPSRAEESEGAPLEIIREVTSELLGAARGTVAGLGIGCPGVVDPARGATVGRTPHLPHWESLPLRDVLTESLGLRPVVDNDANLAALAEHRVGAAQGTRVSLTVTVGTGIGCGIVVDGRVLRGAHGGAGELGHLPLDGTYACRCGVPGCVEPEASGDGLVQRARECGIEAEDAGAVFAVAAAGDARAARLVARMTDRLGASIAAAVQLFDPDVVVVGGGVSRAGEALLAPVRAAVMRHALESHRSRLRVVLAELGERAGVVGAGLGAWDACGSSR
jgi:glucokinase